MKKLFYLSFLIAFCNCDDNDDSNTITNTKIESYNSVYGQYDSNQYPVVRSVNLVKLEYDTKGRVSKRIGDVMTYASGSGLGPTITHSYFTTVGYSNNQIKLTKGLSEPGLSPAIKEAVITLDGQKRMVKKCNKFEINVGEVLFDTINFKYKNDKLISYVKTSNQETPRFDIRTFEESSLYYNKKNNLDSIVTITSIKYSDEPYKILKSKKVHIFENYDTSFNPLKKLGIFEETFYRSLSKNNYRRYSVKTGSYYYPDQNFSLEPIASPPTVDYTLNWNLTYDANRNWLYNENN
ncbi:hypothetical protein NAT51_13620 [Flavobacterium amniphilum]|uniref:hypothetical protein n=1 Tax=Flavobacterium amniphilum TaxID=1834035 RepID=UPI00202A603C|nr:hypothetical protein [Flavobacterium amniphilum]MCL9806569.1 hypothetical protein [Flavobacterium amniphilum]